MVSNYDKATQHIRYVGFVQKKTRPWHFLLHNPGTGNRWFGCCLLLGGVVVVTPLIAMMNTCLLLSFFFLHFLLGYLANQMSPTDYFVLTRKYSPN